jgi:hypothetical protein
MHSNAQLQAVVVGTNAKMLSMADKALNAFHFKSYVFARTDQALEFLKSHSADVIMAEVEEGPSVFAKLVRGMARRQILISITSNSVAMREVLNSGAHFVLHRTDSVDPFMAVLRAASGLILKNRRANFRLNVQMTATVRSADRDLGTGTIINLSETGLCVRLGKPVEIGEELSLSFDLPASKRVNVSASARWTKDGRIGVQFTNIVPEQSAYLKEWLEQQFVGMLLRWNPTWRFTSPTKQTSPAAAQA